MQKRTLQIMFVLIMNFIGALNIYFYFKIIYAIFKYGTLEAGALYWLGLIFFTIPLSFFYISYFYNKKNKNKGVTKVEIIILYINVLFVVFSVSLYIFELNTKYFFNFGLKNN